MAETRKTARKRRAPGAQELPFEKSLERLQEIVERLESGDVSLEASLTLFEEGVALSRRCHARLDDAERRLEILVEQAAGDEVAPADPAEFFKDDDDGEASR